MDLIRAIRGADLARLRLLLKRGSDPSHRSPRGRTPLHAAVEEGNVEAVRLLLEAGAPVDAEMPDGLRPLHLAAAYAKIYELTDPERPNPLEARPPETSPRVAQVLLEALQDRYASLPVGLGLRDPLPPGSNADVFVGLLELLGEPAGRQALLDRFELSGIDLEREDPRWSALLRGNPQFLALAELLLQAGADANARDRSGLTPIHYAAEFGEAAMVSLLLSHGAEVDAHALELSLGAERLENADLLHAAGVPPSEAWMGWLAGNGQMAAVIWLIEHGVSPDAVDEEGSTALECALRSGHSEMAQTLLGRGAGVSAAALHAAAEAGLTEMVRLLLDRGADAMGRDALGMTPLHYAARSRTVEVCSLLLEAGAEINARANDGSTPLHWVFEDEYLGVAEGPTISRLLSAGADVSLRDALGRTPGDRARQEGWPEVLAGQGAG